jgi:hypothetical protein
MTVVSPDTVPVIRDRLNMLGEVQLSAIVAHELLDRAANSFRMEIVLEQIAKGEGREAKWAKRVLADINRERPRLKYSSRLVKIEVV